MLKSNGLNRTRWLIFALILVTLIAGLYYLGGMPSGMVQIWPNGTTAQIRSTAESALPPYWGTEFITVVRHLPNFESPNRECIYYSSMASRDAVSFHYGQLLERHGWEVRKTRDGNFYADDRSGRLGQAVTAGTPMTETDRYREPLGYLELSFSDTKDGAIREVKYSLCSRSWDGVARSIAASRKSPSN